MPTRYAAPGRLEVPGFKPPIAEITWAGGGDSRGLARPLAPLPRQGSQDDTQVGAGGEAERFELQGSLVGEGIGLPAWLAS